MGISKTGTRGQYVMHHVMEDTNCEQGYVLRLCMVV